MIVRWKGEEGQVPIVIPASIWQESSLNVLGWIPANKLRG